MLKMKCVDSRVNVNTLALTSVQFTLATVQVPNLALTHTRRITVYEPTKEGSQSMYSKSRHCPFASVSTVTRGHHPSLVSLVRALGQNCGLMGSFPFPPIFPNVFSFFPLRSSFLNLCHICTRTANSRFLYQIKSCFPKNKFLCKESSAYSHFSSSLGKPTSSMNREVSTRFLLFVAFIHTTVLIYYTPVNKRDFNTCSSKNNFLKSL
jgi:hypothetical protein